MYASTFVTASSAIVTVISTGTTWANTKHVSLNDPKRLYLSNLSTSVTVFVGGESMTTASVGYALFPTNRVDLPLTRESDAIKVLTSAGVSAVVTVLANNS